MSDYYGDKIYGEVSAEVTNWPTLSDEQLRKRMRFEAAKTAMGGIIFPALKQALGEK